MSNNEPKMWIEFVKSNKTVYFTEDPCRSTYCSRKRGGGRKEQYLSSGAGTVKYLYEQEDGSAGRGTCSRA